MSKLLTRAVLIVSGLLLPGSLSGREILVDSLPEAVPSEVGEASLGVLPGGQLAQQFRTNGRGAISSLEILAYRVGQPGGSLQFELWEDHDSSPGKRVAILGSVEGADLRPFQDLAAQGWQELVLDQVVTDLLPLTSYFVVINATQLVGDASRAVYLAQLPRTREMPHRLLAQQDNSWEVQAARNLAVEIAVEEEVPQTRVRTIYRNMPTGSYIPPGAAGAIRRVDLGAQIIRANEWGLISSMTIAVFKVGNPTGITKVQVWTEVDGKPGSLVGTLGEFDVATLRRGQFEEANWQVMTLQNPVSGLEPGGTYFIVSDPGELFVNNRNFPCVAVAYTDDGTNGSHEIMVWVEDDDEGDEIQDWFLFSHPIFPEPIFPDADHARFRMTLTADPADLPAPVISRTTVSTNTVKLTWDSYASLTYAVEYSTTLEEGSWVEVATGIESGGSETSYEDSEPARFGAGKGYYRVRLEL